MTKVSCEHCKKKRLITHLRIEHNIVNQVPQSFSCHAIGCNRSFSSKKSLLAHQKSKHNELTTDHDERNTHNDSITVALY